MRVRLLYQFFHPEEVVSARVYTDLARSLVKRGYEVEATPCNRPRYGAAASHPARETYDGISIRRFPRPPLPMRFDSSRATNALWMTSAFSLDVVRDPPDVLVIGTDPVMACAVAPIARHRHPAIKIVHWVFDLYPEAAFADGMFSEDSVAGRTTRAIMARAYRACDLIVDIGPCMRERLERYETSAKRRTLTPWALVEPSEVAPVHRDVRAELFGDAELGLLYSGNLGRAHAYEEILSLSEALPATARVAFSVRGVGEAGLRHEVTRRGSPVRFAPFAEESALAKRLGAADVHIVSLKPTFTGTVVPSKFFAALAVGRPVVFAGDERSSVARWIAEHGVGWVLTDRNVGEVARALAALTSAEREALNRRCFETYRAFFSREPTCDAFADELDALTD